MKRWAALTVFVYLAALAALAVPVLMLFMGTRPITLEQPLKLSEAVQVYANPGFWTWLAILGAAQAVLLFVPVRIAGERPRSRRSLFFPVIAASFCLANLLYCAVLSICCVIFRDGALDLLAALGKPIVSEEGSRQFIVGAAIVLTFFWCAWGTVFYAASRRGDADGALNRAVSWLLRGSVAELLVAVPTHVIVRRRDDCCAPAATFWGIVTGLSVLLLAFGPGVYFLFVRRAGEMRKAQPARPSP